MKRMPGLTIVVVLIIATLSFIFFNFMQGVGQQAASPNVSVPTPPAVTSLPSTPDPSKPTATALPPPVFTPWYTPLPPPVIGPSPTQQPTISPEPEIIPFPPTVSSWAVFPGTKTAISFSFPAGWSVTEYLTVAPAYSAEPQVAIYLANFDLAKAAARSGLPAGALKIDILSYQNALPTQGEAVLVGPQRYIGRRIILDRSAGFELPPSIERSVSIYFTMANRNWVIFAGFGAPKTIAEQNTVIFDQIVGSLHYVNK